MSLLTHLHVISKLLDSLNLKITRFLGLFVVILLGSNLKNTSFSRGLWGSCLSRRRLPTSSVGFRGGYLFPCRVGGGTDPTPLRLEGSGALRGVLSVTPPDPNGGAP